MKNKSLFWKASSVHLQGYLKETKHELNLPSTVCKYKSKSTQNCWYNETDHVFGHFFFSPNLNIVRPNRLPNWLWISSGRTNMRSSILLIVLIFHYQFVHFEQKHIKKPHYRRMNEGISQVSDNNISYAYFDWDKHPNRKKALCAETNIYPNTEFLESILICCDNCWATREHSLALLILSLSYWK